MSAFGPVPADVLRQVRRLELRTRRLVDSRFAGDYRSLFKGQGMEFAEVREYQPGDEVRTIDWNVSARMGRPFVKRYVEERELTVMLALDVSGSAQFGTAARQKAELLAELSAVLALAAVRNNDRIGVLGFSDRVELAVPPRKGRRHALRLVRDLLTLQPVGRRTAFAPALERLARLLPHRAVVFVCSDFIGPDLEQPLARLAKRHDVIAVTVEDPAEQRLPNVGLARLVDPETGEEVEVDTGDAAVRAWFEAQVAAEGRARQQLFGRLGLDEVLVRTDLGYVEPLLGFFRARAQRAHGAVRSVARAARTAVGAAGLLVAGMAASLIAGTAAGAQRPAGERTGEGDGLAGRVRAGVLVRPDTVEVGDPFTVVVRVRVPAEATVQWPALDDTTTTIALRAPAVRRAGAVETGVREEVFEIPVAAWDTGALATTWPPALVLLGRDTVPVRLADARVHVRSVLPADTAQHVPRPARPVFPTPAPWWTRWWPALVLAALLAALLGWRWWRGRRPAVQPAVITAETPYERAVHAFARLEALAFDASGEHGRSVTLALEILRTYLTARVPGTSLAQTSAELLSLVSGERAPSSVPVEALLSLLVTADAVKYAQRPLEASEAVAFVREARALVETIEQQHLAHAAIGGVTMTAAAGRRHAATVRA